MRQCLIFAALLTAILGIGTTARAASDLFPPVEAPDEPSTEVTRFAIGGGVNLSEPSPGWQGTLSIMGENRLSAMLTQFSLGIEQVGTRAAGEADPSGHVRQGALAMNLYALGVGPLRLGLGADVAYAFSPQGASAEGATGWGWGWRAGGGLSLHPGPFNLWILGAYRWLTGDRVGGWFFDVAIGPD